MASWAGRDGEADRINQVEAGRAKRKLCNEVYKAGTFIFIKQREKRDFETPPSSESIKNKALLKGVEKEY